MVQSFPTESTFDMFAQPAPVFYAFPIKAKYWSTTFCRQNDCKTLKCLTLDTTKDLTVIMMPCVIISLKVILEPPSKKDSEWEFLPRFKIRCWPGSKKDSDLPSPSAPVEQSLSRTWCGNIITPVQSGTYWGGYWSALVWVLVSVLVLGNSITPAQSGTYRGILVSWRVSAQLSGVAIS